MDKLPKLSQSEIDKIFNDPKTLQELKEKMESFENKMKEESRKPFYHCDMCRDTKWVMVCGGPNQPCPCCGPRY